MKYAMNSPVGRIAYSIDEGRLTQLWFVARSDDPAPPPDCPVATQLGEFFRRERRDFDLDLAPSGTDFQQSVWRELLKIPYGETRSYMQIAQKLGKPDAVRAVGTANGANPIALIIPCHRVIGSNGGLIGYAGGLDQKARLLDFEQGIVSLFD